MDVDLCVHVYIMLFLSAVWLSTDENVAHVICVGRCCQDTDKLTEINKLLPNLLP